MVRRKPLAQKRNFRYRVRLLPDGSLSEPDTPRTEWTFTVPASAVDSDLIDFPMPIPAEILTGFIEQAGVDPGLVRVYKADGVTEVPIDPALQTASGTLYAKSDFSSTVDTTLVIKLDGTGLRASTDPLGRQEVWADYDTVISDGFLLLRESSSVTPNEINGASVIEDNFFVFSGGSRRLESNLRGGGGSSTPWSQSIVFKTGSSIPAGRMHVGGRYYSSGNYLPFGTTDQFSNGKELAFSNDEHNGPWATGDTPVVAATDTLYHLATQHSQPDNNRKFFIDGAKVSEDTDDRSYSVSTKLYLGEPHVDTTQWAETDAKIKFFAWRVDPGLILPDAWYIVEGLAHQGNLAVIS